MAAIRSDRYRGSNLVELIYRFLLYAAVIVGAFIFALPCSSDLQFIRKYTTPL